MIHFWGRWHEIELVFRLIWNFIWQRTWNFSKILTRATSQHCHEAKTSVFGGDCQWWTLIYLTFLMNISKKQKNINKNEYLSFYCRNFCHPKLAKNWMFQWLMIERIFLDPELWRFISRKKSYFYKSLVRIRMNSYFLNTAYKFSIRNSLICIWVIFFQTYFPGYDAL